MSDFKRGVTCLKPQPLMLRGRVGWDSALDRHSLSQTYAANKTVPNSIVPSDIASSPTNTHQPRIICLSCPMCNACVLSSHSAFQLVDLDIACKCNICNINIKAMLWNCKCQVPWHLCQIHKYCHISDRSPSHAHSSKKPRTIPTMTQDELIIQDNKRARRGPYVPLPPQSSILSSGLRDRFARLLDT